MPLADLLMERFKVRTRAVENPEGVATALITPQKILGNNPNRLGAIIINLGATPSFIALSDQVTVDTYGVRLDANGGRASLIWDEDFEMTGWAWWIISSASPAVYCIEVVEY